MATIDQVSAVAGSGSDFDHWVFDSFLAHRLVDPLGLVDPFPDLVGLDCPDSRRFGRFDSDHFCFPHLDLADLVGSDLLFLPDPFCHPCFRPEEVGFFSKRSCATAKL